MNSDRRENVRLQKEFLFEI